VKWYIPIYWRLTWAPTFNSSLAFTGQHESRVLVKLWSLSIAWNNIDFPGKLCNCTLLICSTLSLWVHNLVARIPQESILFSLVLFSFSTMSSEHLKIVRMMLDRIYTSWNDLTGRFSISPLPLNYIHTPLSHPAYSI
jgi:hypothetical protein